MSNLVFIFKIIIFFVIIYLVRHFEKFSIYILQKLGSFYIKCAQFLSSRKDLVGYTRSDKLTKLQYAVSYDKNIKLDLPEILLENIEYINEIPIKSASIALVYKARLKNGCDIAIKIVKQKEKMKLINECKTIAKFGKVLHKFRILKRFNFEKITNEISSNILQELSMTKEALNINHFRFLIKDISAISAPFIYTKFCTENIIVMSWIDGMTILEVNKDSNIALQEKRRIAKEILDSHLTQAYIDNIFHADLHTSNIMYGKDKKIYFIDFGAYCKISKADANALLEIIRAFLHKDYLKLAKIHKQIGWIENGTNLNEFSNECKKIGDLYFNSNNLSIGEIFHSLIQVSNKFGMEIQPQLILLQKTMAMIEGLIRNLDENCNVLQLSKDKIDEIYFRLFIYKVINNILCWFKL